MRVDGGARSLTLSLMLSAAKSNGFAAPTVA